MRQGSEIKELIVDAAVVQAALTQRVMARWDGDPPRIVDDVEAVLEEARRQTDPLARGKRTLLITRRKGPFLTPCQGMTGRHRACCDYHVLNVVENCPLDCSYCILQGYLDKPLIVLNANLEGLADEIARARHAPRNAEMGAGGSCPAVRLLRIGTGELGDSLALDRLTGLSLDLMKMVAPFDDVVLELKTKTVEIENLLTVPAPPNVIISWSLNTPRHVASEETGAAPLDARLDAARRCRQHGYRIGLHFDPLIHSPGWEDEYRAVVAALFEHLDPAGIVWISLGALRYPPAMKPVIEERHRRSTITAGELVPSWDGKLRYFRPIRVAMYRRMAEWIAAQAPETAVYLCMESLEIWRDVFGWSPKEVRDVAERLDAGCRKRELAGRAVRAGS